MRLSGKRVLVTGATGFVGGRLVEKLLIEEGASVSCLVRDWTKAVWVSRTMADLFPGNVFEHDAVAAAMKDCDIVIHCASGGTTREQLFQTNVHGTRCLLETAERLGVERFVYVSSIAVHGASPPSGANEAAPLDDSGRPYSASKIEAEKVVMDFVKSGRVAASVIRPTFVWGPRSGLFTVGPLRSMRAGRFFEIDQGQGSCHAVHVDNLVESLILASITPAAVGEAFLITDEAQLAWRDFFEPLSKLLSISEVPSVNSTSIALPMLCQLRDASGHLVTRLAGDGRTLPVRVIRRLCREVETRLARKGIPSLWDLRKFARRGPLDTSKSLKILGYRPVLSFQAAVEQTLQWVILQMSDELGLSAGRSRKPVKQNE